MPRAGLTTDFVVTSAAQMVDEVGADRLTLTALAARLGIRQPSLYNHVGGLDDLQRRIAVKTKAEIAGVFARAAIGRSRDEALIAMSHAYRDWALQHPSRYQAAQRAALNGDAEEEAVRDDVLHTLAAVLAGYDLDGDDMTDAIRAFRSVLHGFVALETIGAFGLPRSVDRSFDRLVDSLVVAMTNWKDRAQAARETAPETVAGRSHD